MIIDFDKKNAANMVRATNTSLSEFHFLSNVRVACLIVQL